CGESGIFRFKATTEAGTDAIVRLDMRHSFVHMQVQPSVPGSYIIEARTAPIGPVYGLGDYGSHVDTVETEDAPEIGKLDIPARDTAEITGIVRNDLVNQGTNMRFITTFTV